MPQQKREPFLQKKRIDFLGYMCYHINQCGSSSAVERRLPKPKVAGSNPVSRSTPAVCNSCAAGFSFLSLTARVLGGYLFYNTNPYLRCAIRAPQVFFVSKPASRPYAFRSLRSGNYDTAASWTKPLHVRLLLFFRHKNNAYRRAAIGKISG